MENSKTKANNNDVVKNEDNSSGAPEETVTKQKKQKEVKTVKSTEKTKPQAEKTEPKLQKENKQLKKELEEQKDKYLRLLAEYDNYRKRTQKEKSDAYTEGIAAAVINFLPLIDNMERALSYTPDDEGMKALVKQVEDILKSMDVKAIESDNKPFDPNFHNAIMHEEDDTVDGCIIVETFQKGYVLGDKVLRHSMVKVVN